MSLNALNRIRSPFSIFAPVKSCIHEADQLVGYLRMAYLWECRQQRLIPSFVPEAEHQKAGIDPSLKQILKQMQMSVTDQDVHEDQISLLSLRVTCASGPVRVF
jgi:hypothetical protein